MLISRPGLAGRAKADRASRCAESTSSSCHAPTRQMTVTRDSARRESAREAACPWVRRDWKWDRSACRLELDKPRRRRACRPTTARGCKRGERRGGGAGERRRPTDVLAWADLRHGVSRVRRNGSGSGGGGGGGGCDAQRAGSGLERRGPGQASLKDIGKRRKGERRGAGAGTGRDRVAGGGHGDGTGRRDAGARGKTDESYFQGQRRGRVMQALVD